MLDQIDHLGSTQLNFIKKKKKQIQVECLGIQKREFFLCLAGTWCQMGEAMIKGKGSSSHDPG